MRRFREKKRLTLARAEYNSFPTNEPTLATARLGLGALTTRRELTAAPGKFAEGYCISGSGVRIGIALPLMTEMTRPSSMSTFRA